MDRRAVSLFMLPKVRQDSLIGSIDLLPLLCPGEYNLATCEYKQHQLRHLHSEDESREQLWLVATHLGLLLLHVVV